MSELEQLLLRVIGPTTLQGDESPGPVQARLLTALVAFGETGGSVRRLESLVWPDDVPATSRASLHNHVTRLRRRLGEDAIVWTGARYRLNAKIVSTDVDALLNLRDAVQVARGNGNWPAVLATAEAARELHRGVPYADIPGDLLRSERQHVEDVLGMLAEASATALYEIGRVEEAAMAWRSLIDVNSHHEARWVGLIDALHAAGRRAEALAAFRQARQVLADDLGLAPSAALVAAHDRVLHDNAHRNAYPPYSVPRPVPFERLHALLRNHGIVALHGEPGIGKTTIAATIADNRDGALTIHVHCRENTRAPLRPLVDVVAALSSELRALEPPVGAAVCHMLGWPAPDRAGPTLALVEEVADALARVFDRRAVTVVLDDASRVGPTTWRVLAAARDRAPTLRLLLVTSNPADIPSLFAQSLPHLTLSGLDIDQVDELVGKLLKRTGQVRLLSGWVHDVTDGSPLYVTELVAELQRAGVIRFSPGGAEPPARLPAPPRLRAVVQQRLGAFDAAVRRSLEAVAVLGADVDDGVLVELGADPTDLVAAADAGVVRIENGHWRFSHELIRGVARDLIPQGRRLDLELSAAAALEARDAAASVVAHHRFEAARADPFGAAGAALQAANDACAVQTFEEAAAWADPGRAVLNGRTDQGERIAVELAMVAANARRLAGAPGHADELLDAAELALALDDGPLRRRAVLATLQLGACCQPGPHQARAVLLADRSLDLETEPSGRALLHAAASLTHSMIDPAASRAHFRQAYELADDVDSFTLLEVLPYAYLGLGLPGDLADRSAATRRLAEAASEHDDAAAAFEACHLRFSTALQYGDGDAMRDAHDEMIRLAPRAADAGRRWSLGYQRATLLQLSGDFAAAEDASLAALAIGATVAPWRANATHAATLFEVRRLQHRLDELVPLVEGLLADPAGLPAWRAVAALVLARERPGESLAIVGAATSGLDRLPCDFSYGATILTLARAIVALKAHDHAAQVLDRLRPWADLMSWQGTTTYGPYGEAVADLGSLVGDREAVAVGRAGATRATARLGSEVYAR